MLLSKWTDRSKQSSKRIAFRSVSPKDAESPEHQIFAKFLEAAYSSATRTTYKREVGSFIKWGGSIPATPETIATYLAEHAGLLASATLSKKLAALHRAHVTLGYESPVRTDLVRNTLRGIRRIHFRKERRVKPLLKKHLEAIFFRHLHGLQGVRDRALLLLGFLGGFRRSELTNLNVEDVSFRDSGMVVRLNRSKTDQQGEGRDVPIPMLDSHLCAVKAVKEWLAASGISHGALFRGVDRLGAVGASKLTSGMVARIIKKYIEKIGIDPGEYSGHSLRAGLVTSAAIAGAAEWQIRKQTGHKSNEMVGRYIRQSEMFSDNVATMIANFSASK